jgi:hypothetical protein
MAGPGRSPADDARGLGTFLRGLTIGALIGAVIAGSTIWSRRRQWFPKGAPSFRGWR